MNHDDEKDGAFVLPNVWKKPQYKLENREGVLCLVAITSSEIDYSNPLNGQVFDKQPWHNEDHIKRAPHLALAYINLNNEEEILSFVNNHGLLGLWNIPKYYKTFQNESDYRGEAYLNWFIHPHKKGFYRYQEPLSLFKEAAQDYQDALKQIKEVEQTGQPNQLLELFLNDMSKNVMPSGLHWNGKWELGWQFNSLLGAIYLQFTLEKIGGISKIFICNKCGRLYLSIRPESKYCSLQCKSSHKKYQNYINKTKRKLYEEHSGVLTEQMISTLVDQLIENGVTGDKKIRRSIEKYIQNDMNWRK